LNSQEKKGSTQGKKRGKDSLTSNEANARVFIRSRNKLFYYRTIEMKHDEREQRRQTKLSQNNRSESSREMKGEVRLRRDMAWRGVAPCDARRGMARRSMGKGRLAKGGETSVACMWHCVVVSGGGEGGCWRRALAAGSLGALSNVAVVWRGCSLMWTWTAAVAVRARARG
jgi:hypothetical protein